MNSITKDMMENLVSQLYGTFETGWDFEEFVKILLIKMGLEDVTVTSKTADGGIDVIAVRRGVDGLSNVDEIKYVVQAKRYKPGKPVSIVDVRALRGVLPSSSKGIFITTGRFPKSAEAFAVEDESRPILLLDGESVINLCIEHKIGFRFEPVFDPEFLATQLKKGKPEQSKPKDGIVALRQVSSNDIRARILGVPTAIAQFLDPSRKKLTVCFPPDFGNNDYTYRSDRRYLAGVKKVMRHYGLLLPSGERNPRLSEWTYEPNKNLITVTFKDDSVS